MDQQFNILIYEPNDSLGSMLKEFFLSENFSVTLFTNIEEFNNSTLSVPVLGIISLINNIDSGFALAETLKKQKEETSLVFIDNHPIKEVIVKAYNIGADDFIRAPFHIEELYLRICAILKRKHKIKKEENNVSIYKIGEYYFDTIKQTLAYKQTSQKLTTKEAELLTLLCQNANTLIERERVLKIIWKSDTYFNARSMDVYITKLRKLLRQDSSVAIINIHGKGYKLATNQ